MWALLAWLYPRAVRNAVPAARVMVWTYTIALAVAAVYSALAAPEGWALMGPQMPDGPFDRAMFVVTIAMSAVATLSIVALIGPPWAQLVVATVLSCWAGLVAYAAVKVSLPAGLADATATRLLLGAYTYALWGSGLVVLIALPVLRSIVRALDRQQAAQPSQ